MQPRGEEFRDDIRERLPAEVLRPLTRLSAARSTIAITQTVVSIVVIVGLAVATWTPWTVVPAVLAIGTLQHALFILAHDAAHFRLYESRALNDAVGRVLGMASGISMCTYRVIHRLHHNHLYGPQDPDVALHGGYPRGRLYLVRKLAKDLCGLTAWKSYAYFFGHPAIDARQGVSARPLDDTSPALRRQARRDRWWVVSFQVGLLVAAMATGNFWQYLLLWVLPAVTVLQALLRLRAICEHGAVSDLTTPFKSARTTLALSWARALLFPHHVNYHLAHHLYPAVPHYYLPRLHAALAAHGLLRDAEVRTLNATLGRVFAAAETRVVQ